MFRKCCVPVCNNIRQDVKLHKLPAAEDSKNRWLKCIGYENIGELITTNMFVCHKHFEERFVNPITNRLKGDAYPSLFTDLEISSGHPSAVLTKTDAKKTSDHSYSKKRHIDHSYAQPPNKMACLEVEDTCTITSIDQEIAVSSSSSAIQDTCTTVEVTDPSEHVVASFGNIITCTNEYLEQHGHKTNISETIKQEICSKYSFAFLNCQSHREIVLDQLLKISIKLCIFNWCNVINKILKGTDIQRAEKCNLHPMQKKALLKYKKKLKNKKLFK